MNIACKHSGKTFWKSHCDFLNRSILSSSECGQCPYYEESDKNAKIDLEDVKKDICEVRDLYNEIVWHCIEWVITLDKTHQDEIISRRDRVEKIIEKY